MIAVDPLPEVKARDVVFQILEGVQHLHALNIVHMDLKVHIMYSCMTSKCVFRDLEMCPY